MKNAFRSIYRGTVALLLLGALSLGLSACIDDSDAESSAPVASGPTDAEFAELEQRVADLEAVVASLENATGSKPFNRLYAESPSTSTAAQKVAPLTDLGDPIDCTDGGVDLRACRVISPTGFLGEIPLNQNPTVPRTMVNVFYQQAGCQGQPYTAGNQADFVTAGENGVYYMTEGQGSIGTIIVVSYRNPDGNCLPADPGPYEVQMAYELTPNDPAITGFEDSWPSETTFGQPN